MTSSEIVDGRSQTSHEELADWVRDISELTRPEEVVWCDGSDSEWERLTSLLVENGTFTRLNPKIRPNSFRCASDPSDVARVEDRTFICSEKEDDAGPTNNWIAPDEMRKTFAGIFDGCMRGRTMYVVPFCMGPLGGNISQLGVEITDSPYVVVSMRIMARMGAPALRWIEERGSFVRAVHSVGAPLEPGQADVPWPCSATKYISHFPETREIWSYGSGYGGNALLGKKCYALRIASATGAGRRMARRAHAHPQESPRPRVTPTYMAAAFPSACGKTNLAMLQPDRFPGWKVETVGDDIAWMRVGEDGRLYAINPEAGFFGVAPGTEVNTNPNAIDDTVAQQHLHQRRPHRRRRRVVGGPHRPATRPSDRLEGPGLDARFGRARPRTPTRASPPRPPSARSSHRNGTTPRACRSRRILFGGRRATAVPLVTEAFDWAHGVFLGATSPRRRPRPPMGKVGESAL